MASAPGSPFPGPSPMEIDNPVRDPAPASTNLPGPNVEVFPVSPRLITAAPPTRNMSARNGMEPGSEQSIAFPLNASQGQEPPPAIGGPAHLPHNAVRPSGHEAQIPLRENPGEFVPEIHRRTCYISHTLETAACRSSAHGVHGSPGGLSVLSEHGSFVSPRSCTGGPSNRRVLNTPSARSVASQSPVTPFWDSPMPRRCFEDESPRMDESQSGRGLDDRSHTVHSVPFQMLPPSRSGDYGVQRELYSGNDASSRVPNGTFAPEIEARRAFKRADRGHQGYLDFRSFLEAIRDLNVSLVHQEAQQCFYHMLDSDKDGRITETEFVKGYLNDRFSIHLRR